MQVNHRRSKQMVRRRIDVHLEKTSGGNRAYPVRQQKWKTKQRQRLCRMTLRMFDIHLVYFNILIFQRATSASAGVFILLFRIMKHFVVRTAGFDKPAADARRLNRQHHYPLRMCASAVIHAYSHEGGDTVNQQQYDRCQLHDEENFCKDTKKN